MTPTEILTRARRLIEEKGWTQGQYARDRNEIGCDPSAKHAACFCSLGALRVASEGEGFREFMDAQVLLSFAMGETGIAAWNDTRGRTKADVLAAFDKAIELSRRSEP